MAVLAERNNNPGNLKDPATGTFRQFASPQEGYAALLNDLKGKQTGNTSTGLHGESTLADFSNKYAPSTDKNNPAQYTANLANIMKVRPDSKLKELNLGAWADAVAKAEGYKGPTSTPQISAGGTPVAQAAGAPPSQPPVNPAASHPQGEGFVKGLVRAVAQPVVTSLARPFQAVARIAGVSPETVNSVSSKVPFFGEGGRLDIPQTGSDVVKDIGRAAQTVALGLPVASIPKAIGAGAVMGAGAGLEQNPSVGGALSGAASGAALGGAGGLAAKALEWLPKSLASSAFKKMNPEQIEQTLATKHIGTRANLLKQSETSVAKLGKQLGALIESPEARAANTKTIVTGKDILKMAAQDAQTNQKLLDTGLHYDEIAKKMAAAVPEKAALVKKLFGKGLSVPELHRLNSGLGSKVFKNVLGLDAPEVRAGKDLGNIIYHGAADVIKTLVPGSGEIFDQLSKEYGVRAALDKLANKTPGGLISWRDIVPFLTGSAAFGPVGGAAAAVGTRVAENPAVQFAGAKGIKGLSRVANPALRRSGLLSPTLIPSGRGKQAPQ